MNQEETWVSHTPDDTSHCNKETEEEDFISAAAETKPIRSISPPTPFEKFFLPIAEDEGNILANRLRRVNKNTVSSRSAASSESVITEDFCSAQGTELSDLDDLSFEDNTIKNIYANDILGIAHPTIFEEDESVTMVRSKTTKVDPTATPETPKVAEPEVTIPAPTTTASKDPNFDVIENVYGGAKAAWSFGKGIILFRPFMGLAEDAATKVLSMTTGAESLEAVDKEIIHHLSSVDKEFVDPAILKLCSVISPIIGKGDDIIKSMVGIFMKPALGGAN